MSWSVLSTFCSKAFTRGSYLFRIVFGSKGFEVFGARFNFGIADIIASIVSSADAGGEGRRFFCHRRFESLFFALYTLDGGLWCDFSPPANKRLSQRHILFWKIIDSPTENKRVGLLSVA
jgi:hypothetical protein